MSGQTIIIRLFEDDLLQSILRTDFVQEHLPHCPLRFRGQLAIPKRHVDARLEGIVERLHAIGRKEQYALEIFKETEEDGDQGIAVDILDGALLQEHIGFVKE